MHDPDKNDSAAIVQCNNCRNVYCDNFLDLATENCFTLKNEFIML